MNDIRRTKLRRVIKAIESIREDLEAISGEETDAFDNLPEGIQIGDRGTTMEQIAEALSFVADDLGNAVETIQEQIDLVLE